MHGMGTFCFADGTVHTGRWVNNRRNGKGISKYKHGHVYEGMWKDDKPHLSVEEYFGPWAVFLPHIDNMGK